MRKFIVTALAVGLAMIAADTSVRAEGLPRSAGPTQSNWNGFYFGVHAGRAWGDADFRTDTGAVTATSYFAFPENIASVNQSGSGSSGTDTAVAGVQIGTNMQRGAWVFGLEADYGVFNLSASRAASDVPYPAAGSVPFKYSVRASMDTDWLVTARARVGFAPQPSLLVYVTGGLALTNLRVSNSFSDDAPEQGLGGSSADEIKAGWTVGGGAEILLTRNWSVKAEYMYLDFGSVSTAGSITCGPGGVAICDFFGVTPSPFTSSADISAHTARVGLNYRF
jgi:outer membrane immunogenic protein